MFGKSGKEVESQKLDMDFVLKGHAFRGAGKGSKQIRARLKAAPLQINTPS
jgi:hypothetical protein